MREAGAERLYVRLFQRPEFDEPHAPPGRRLGGDGTRLGRREEAAREAVDITGAIDPLDVDADGSAVPDGAGDGATRVREAKVDPMVGKPAGDLRLSGRRGVEAPRRRIGAVLIAEHSPQQR